MLTLTKYRAATTPGHGAAVLHATLLNATLLAFVLAPDGQAQQLSINRVDLMPNLPAPYQMRDWKLVAQGYDQFVFDFSKTGTYLPLGWKYSSTVNYPNHGSFGLDTVVGTPRDNDAEAINVLPAVVGASRRKLGPDGRGVFQPPTRRERVSQQSVDPKRRRLVV